MVGNVETILSSNFFVGTLGQSEIIKYNCYVIKNLTLTGLDLSLWKFSDVKFLPLHLSSDSYCLVKYLHICIKTISGDDIVVVVNNS